MRVTHTVLPTASDRAADHLLSLQHAAGCWEGEMVWCPVVTAQVAIARHVVGRPFSAEDAAKIVLHFERTRTADGAFGLHPEHACSVFVTSMVYVAARLLGVSADHPLTAAARKWLHARPGGVLSAPTWGKFWLALLGLYGCDGLRPLVPELVLLPKAVPVHPLRFYCHTRYVYLAMAILQGGRVQFDIGPLADDLRRELYGPAGPPAGFREHRYHLAAEDAFEPPNLLIRAAERVLGWYDRFPIRKLREAALRTCADLIARDLDATDYLTLSPVNGVLNALALHARGADPAEVAKCVDGFEFYRWDDDARGLRYAGGRTRVWDTGFAVEALLANPAAADEHREPLLRAYRFLAAQQMTRSVAGRDPLFPDTAEGGWCLGDAANGWPVSDCTAEALAAVLGMHAVIEPPERIPDARLAQAVFSSAVSVGSAPEAKANPVRQTRGEGMGRLGFPLGTPLTIEGVRSERGNGGARRAPEPPEDGTPNGVVECFSGPLAGHALRAAHVLERLQHHPRPQACGVHRQRELLFLPHAPLLSLRSSSVPRILLGTLYPR